MNPHRQETYDVASHLKARNAMFACWALMFAFWGFAWCADWVAAGLSMLANGYFLLSLWFFFKLYPEKRYES